MQKLKLHFNKTPRPHTWGWGGSANHHLPEKGNICSAPTNRTELLRRGGKRHGQSPHTPQTSTQSRTASCHGGGWGEKHENFSPQHTEGSGRRNNTGARPRRAAREVKGEGGREAAVATGPWRRRPQPGEAHTAGPGGIHHPEPPEEEEEEEEKGKEEEEGAGG